jgi:hypothetical protein
MSLERGGHGIGYNTASLAAFTGRALMIFRAGFALNIAGSFVNGLMPLRSFVVTYRTERLDDGFDVLARHRMFRGDLLNEF